MKKGDEVVYISDTGGGEVLSVNDDGTVLILDDHGFETLVLRNEIMLRDQLGINEEVLFSDQIRLKSADQETLAVKPKKELPSNLIEIDLHIHEITEEAIETAGTRLIDVQMNYFINELEKARRKGVRQIIVIHGVGQGKLKSEVRKYLSHLGYAYEDANLLKYGTGATEVFLGGN
jgi:dsDNA-specific endonuclease/ATPase MutS2